MKYPLKHPEAKALFSELLVSLTAESDRGALLVGAAHVDNCLRSLLEAVLPDDLSKGDRKQLLKYPGPLSAFAARNQVAYGMRLIPRSAYDSVNALREIRNVVAHQPEAFDLQTHEARVRKIYAALGADFPEGLWSIAVEMMLDYKVHVVMKAAQEAAAKDPETGLVVSTKQEAIEFIRDERDAHQPLREELLHWELAIGIAALCGFLIIYRDEAVATLGSNGTVGRLGRSWASRSDPPAAEPPG